MHNPPSGWPYADTSSLLSSTTPASSSASRPGPCPCAALPLLLLFLRGSSSPMATSWLSTSSSSAVRAEGTGPSGPPWDPEAAEPGRADRGRAEEAGSSESDSCGGGV